VKDISTVINRFDDLKKEYMWTKFEWMTGYFIMCHNNYTIFKSFGQNVCSAQIVVDEMSLTLEEANNILFRWDLNAKYVWEFHKILMSSLQNFHNNFVFYHAYIFMKYLNKVTNVSEKIYVRVIQTFMVYETWTKDIFTFINLSHTINEERNINFKDIYKMITKNCLNELLEELKKFNQKKLSNWNNKIDTININDENLNDTLSELIFTNILNFKKYIFEFKKYIIHSELINKYYYLKTPDSIETQFKDFFKNNDTI